MQIKRKSNISYHNHSRDNKSISNDLNGKPENQISYKVHFDDEILNFNTIENLKNDETKNYNSDAHINNNKEFEHNLESLNEIKCNKSNNFDNSRVVTASFFSNNSLIVNDKGVKQIRRNRYNKSYAQIIREKTEYSKSIDEYNNSIFNKSKLGNLNNSNSDLKKFDHSNCGHFKNKTIPNNNNCLQHLESKSMNIKTKKTPTHSQKGSFDTNIKNDKRQNTQISNFMENNNNSYLNTNHSQINNKNQNNLTRQNFGKNKGNISENMNQEELKNNLLKINSTSLTPFKNINLSSSIINVLTETNRLQNENINNSKSQGNNANQQDKCSFSDFNRINNLTNEKSNNILNQRNSLDSPKMMTKINNQNISKETSNNDKNFTKLNNNNQFSKSISTIESNLENNFNTSNNFNSFKSNFDNNQAKLSFSNENFYKQKNKNIGSVKVSNMNRTDPKAFQKLKNQNGNSCYSPKNVEKGDFSKGITSSIGKSYENYDNNMIQNNVSLQKKNLQNQNSENSTDKIYDYPKRDSNNNSFFNIISSPTNSIGRKINSNLKSPTVKNTGTIQNSTHTYNPYNSNNYDNNILKNISKASNKINPNLKNPQQNLDSENSDDCNFLVNHSGKPGAFNYDSPKSNSDKKQTDFTYNNPRVNSNNYNSTEGDQLTLIEEADEKIAGHISEENINLKENNSIKNLNDIKNTISDKSGNTIKEKIENENNLREIIKSADKQPELKQLNSKIKGKINEVEKSNLNKDELNFFNECFDSSKDKTEIKNSQENKETLVEKTILDNKKLNDLKNNKKSDFLHDSNNVNNISKINKNKNDHNQINNNQSNIIKNASIDEDPKATNNLSQHYNKNSNIVPIDNHLTNKMNVLNFDSNLIFNNINQKINTNTNNKSTKNAINEKLQKDSDINGKTKTLIISRNSNSDKKANKLNPLNKNIRNSGSKNKGSASKQNNLYPNIKTSVVNALNIVKLKSPQKSISQLDDEENSIQNNNLNDIKFKNKINNLKNNLNTNKSNLYNLTEDSIYNKRAANLGTYLVNKTKNQDENKNKTNKNMMNLKTENIKKYINDQDDKISNFDNININFSPNRYSRITMSSFRESADFDLDKRFSNSITNNDDLFSSEEAKKSVSKSKIIKSPKSTINNVKNQKSNLKNIVNKIKYNSKPNENKKVDDNAKIKDLNNSLTNVLGGNSMLKSQIIEKIETQYKNNINTTGGSVRNENNDKNINKNNNKKQNLFNKKSVESPIKNNINHFRSISMQQQEKKENNNTNNFNQSCGNLNNLLQSGFQRIISKSNRGKNYYVKTENEEIIDENKKKSYRDFELEIVPINNVVLNYKEEDDSLIKKFKNDLILPTNFNQRLRNIFNKNKKYKITSKVEKRYFCSVDFYNSASNFGFKAKRDLFGLTFNNMHTLSPINNFRDKNLKFQDFRFFQSLSPNRYLDRISFSPFSQSDSFKNNSFKKAIDKYYKLDEIKNKFNRNNYFSLSNKTLSGDTEEKNLISIDSPKNFNMNNLQKNSNNREESKSLKEIKKSLEQLNCDFDNNLINSIRNSRNNFTTEVNSIKGYSPKKQNAITLDNNNNFILETKNYNPNYSNSRNKFFSQNNFNYIYDMSNNKNNFNSLNSINSFSFQQSPKNNSINNFNTINPINQSTYNNNNSPYKIGHPICLNYLPDVLTNNVELAEPFQNNIITKLINKNNNSVKTLNNNNNENETLIIQNTVNETLNNSLRNKKNIVDLSNKKKLNSQSNPRSKSLGRSGKFIPEMFKKFTVSTIENDNSKNHVSKGIYDTSKDNNNNDNTNRRRSISNDKALDNSRDDILIEDEKKFNKQFNQLRDNIRKIKMTHSRIKSPNTLDDPSFILPKNRESSRSNITQVGKNVNGKIKRLIEENKMLLFDSMNNGNSEIFSKNENSKSRIKSVYSNPNNYLDEQKYLNTISNIGINRNNSNKDKSREFSNISNTPEKTNKSNNLKYLESLVNKNDNLKNIIGKNIPYILSENNTSNTYNYKKNSSKSKLKLEEKINIYIDNKIEENKELRSARYKNVKIMEDLNKKFMEKMNSQIKHKKFTSDEEFNILMSNIKHSDKITLKEFMDSKLKVLEEDIQISDEKLSEFKDKFFKNFGREIERDHIQSFYKKLVISGNNSSNIKENMIGNRGILDSKNKNFFNDKPKYHEKAIIEERIVNKNLEKLKGLLNLEEKDSREMKLYNNLNSNSNRNIKTNYTSFLGNAGSNKLENKIINKIDFKKNDLLLNPISCFNDNFKDKNYGSSLKLSFQNNLSGNPVLPKNDLKLENYKMKNIYDNSNIKYNF